MIRFDDVHAVKLIAQAAGIQFVPVLHHCIARYDSDDKLMGGVLFTDFWGGSMCIHMAGFNPQWVNKAMVFLAFDYPFNKIGVKKMFGLVPEWNHVSRNNTLHLGFKIEYLVADVFNFPHGVNGMYIMSMVKEDCRWLKMKPPKLEIAPRERTNRIDFPLSIVDHTQMTRQ